METKIYIPDKLARKWREYAMKRFGYGRGSISRAAEEALAFWTLREEKIGHMLADMISMCESDLQILALILFGSYARKEIYSDLDVAVVLSRSEEHVSHLNILSRFERVIPDGIEVDVSVFNDLSIEMRSRILSEGNVIYVRDRDSLYDTSIEVIMEYSDFELFTGHARVS
jgi:predicted nucleotidyltransferase